MSEDDCEECPGFSGTAIPSTEDCAPCTLPDCDPLPEVIVPSVTQECDPCAATQVHAYKNKCVPAVSNVKAVVASPKGYMEFPVPVPSSAKNILVRDAYAETRLEFVYPAVGKGSIVRITNLKLAEGQFLFHPYYGALYVNQVVNECDGLYDLKNLATSSLNVDVVGLTVPCGTRFALGVLGEGAGATAVGGDCNSLTADFHIPIVNATSPAKVESFVGFKLGAQVLVRNKYSPGEAYTYTLDSFSGIDTLVLRNTGEGGTPGDVLTALDGEDNQVWCVESLSDVPLSEQAVSTICIHELLGFDEEGNLQKISGSLKDEALVYDPTCDGFVRKVVPGTVQCAILETNFQVVPLGNVCNRSPSFITTTNDSLVLTAAQQSLLSGYAEPIIFICDYPFSVDLANSVIGSLKVLPLFNPPDPVSFTGNCSVCIPEDCCTQCAPQVFYPLVTLFPLQPPTSNYPPGYSQATSWAIPTNLIQSEGEHRFSVVKNEAGTANLLLHHPSNSFLVQGAYTEVGGTTQIPATADSLLYQKADYCHVVEACPIVLEYKEDIIVDGLNVPAGVRVFVTYETSLIAYLCNQVGVPAGALSTARSLIMKQFVGPSNQSAVVTGTDPWMGTGLTGELKSYQKSEGSKTREMTLFYPNCLQVKTRILIMVLVSSVPAGDDFIYGSLHSTSIIKGTRI